MPDIPAGAAAERARVLQEHLVRTAYALHFTAADLAAQHERRAGLRVLPSGVDHGVQAKRWSMLSDYALDIVRGWDPGSAELAPVEHPSLAGTSTTCRRSEAVGELAHGVLDRLYLVDAALQGVLADVDSPTQADLRHAMVELGDAIRTVGLISAGTSSLDEGEEDPNDIG